jgi:tripartite-type tricarboxylate transporter receptor subunit TctC
MSQYESGQLKLLAVSAPTRLSSVPQVPALKEEELDFVRFGWLGICAAKGTPHPLLDRLNREIASVVATVEYKKMIENAGSIAISSTPEELAEVIKQTLDETSATMREFGSPQEP